jgi:hypothetical protein
LHRIVNGNSSFLSDGYRRIVGRVADFPSRDAVELLESLQVRLVVLHGDLLRAGGLRRIEDRLAGNSNFIPVGSCGNDRIYRVWSELSVSPPERPGAHGTGRDRPTCVWPATGFQPGRHELNGTCPGSAQ